MSKYKVGDVVKLRDDLEAGKVYGRINFTTKMEELKNKPVEIFYRGFQGDYTVQEGWIINDEMIEGLWEECKSSEQVSKSEGKLKLIDVLNMIAKGELKEGTKVKYGGVEYTYKKFDAEDDESKDLISGSSCSIFEDYFLTILDNEVELIEPPCEHEWEVETIRNCIGNVRIFRRCVKCGFREEANKCVSDEGKTSETTKIEEIQSPEIYGGITYRIIDKLNEVIRKINKEE